MAKKYKTTSKRKKSNAAAVRFMLSALFVLSLFAFKVFTDARLSEKIMESGRIKRDIGILESEEIRLNVEIERKKNLKEIERIAVNEMGMRKPDQFQIEYITLDGTDKSLIIKYDNENVLNGLAKNFAIFLEYFS